MLDTRADSIIYQAQGKLVDLVDDLIINRRLGKKYDSQWDKMDLIVEYLEAWEERNKLDDITQMNYILECLISLTGINEFPAAPTINIATPPAILVGVPGAPGADGVQGPIGPQGPAGLATDFLAASVSLNTTVDSFTITSASAARWDYFAIEATGEQRAGHIIGHWNTAGTLYDLYDSAAPDVSGDTSPLEFDLIVTATTVGLRATVTSGTWTIRGSRYFIPNNGSGTGPVSGVLTNGKVYIGNASNLAQEQFLSGAFTITNTGVATLANDLILNANINSAAAIAVSKLAALSPSLAVVTDGSGFLTTAAGVSATEIGYLANVTSDLQTQLNSKLTDPMTTIGDIIIRNGSNVTVRLGIGSANQVLTVSGGIPAWVTPAAGFADPMTTAGDIIIRNISNVTVRLGIGGANTVLTSSGGVPAWVALPTILTLAGTTNEIQTNNGSGNLGAQKVFASTGNLTLGDTALAGGRLITVESSNASADLQLKVKGSSGGVEILDNPLTRSLNFLRAGFATIQYLVTDTAANPSFSILAAGATSSVVAGQNLVLRGGAAFSTGSLNSGHVYINSGNTGGGSTTKGSISFFNDGSPTFGGGQAVIFINNASAVPTTNPTGGIITYVESGVWKWRDTSGNIYPLNLLSGVSGTTGKIAKFTSSSAIGDSIITESAGAITIAGSTTISGGTNLLVTGVSEFQSGFRTQTSGNYYKVKTVQIGDWNMDTSLSVNVAHGLGAAYKDIRNISVIIRDDADANYYDLYNTSAAGVTGGGSNIIDSTNIALNRTTGAQFDNTSFDATSYNRGWVMIWYEVIAS